MDKINCKGKRVENQAIRRVIRKQKKQLIEAMEAKNIFQRKRVLKDVGVLIMAYYHYIVENWSFRTLSLHMSAKYHVTMSDTAWRKQFLKTADAFLESVLEVTNAMTPAAKPGIYALDSTSLPMEGRTGTVVRAHTCYAVNGSASIYCKVTDVHTAEAVKHFPIQAGSLYLADRGYGYAKNIAYMVEQQANFLFRISPYHIKLYSDEKCTRQMAFDSLMESTSIDQQCYFKFDKKAYPVRLIGQKLPEEQLEHAEKKFDATPAERGRISSKVRSIMPSGYFC